MISFVVAYDSSLTLDNKEIDGTTGYWIAINDSIIATLEYNSIGQELEYSLTSSSFAEDYVLIYYADVDPRFETWGGNPALLLGTLQHGTTSLSGSIDTGDLPYSSDWNLNPDPNYCDYTNGYDDYASCSGAKIWLVPSKYYDESERKVISWKPNEFLFETDLISFEDTGPTITVVETPSWPSCELYPNISAEITDPSGIKFGSVKLNYRYDGFDWDQVSFMNAPVNNVYELEVNWFIPEDNQPFDYYIEAKDIYKNLAVSGNYSFTYDCADPIVSVLGAPSDWVIQKTAEVDCSDDPSDCDETSYKLKIYSSNPGNCPQAYSEYDLGNSKLITDYSWVCATAKDNAGNAGFSSPEEFLVDGVNPTANANGPYYCDEGQTIINLLNASSSSDEDGKNNGNPIVSHDWSNGKSGVSADYTCRNGGNTETVTLTVTDHVGRTGTDSADIIVSNVAPVLDGLDTFSCNEGGQATLVASATDYDGSLTYFWTINGSTEIEGKSITYDCVDGLAVILISVRVWDGEDSTEGMTTVTISNVIPVASITGDSVADEGSDVTLTASYTDAGILDIDPTYSWDLNNDGSEDGTADTFLVDCVDEGQIDVSLTVTDKDGGISIKTSYAVTCKNVAPTIDVIAGQDIDECGTVTIAPTFSDEGVNDVHEIEINWGDTTVDSFVPAVSGDSFSHTYTDDGVYTITVTVRDDFRATDFTTMTVTVMNIPPVIDSTGEPYMGVIGEMITFEASAIDSCDSGELTYKWNFLGGYSSVNTHKWDETGEKIVSLKVCDLTDCVYVDVSVMIYDYKIELDADYCNLISIPLVPESTAIGDVLNEVNPEYVWAYKVNSEGINEWSFYSKDGDVVVGDLSEMIPGYGYYVCMKAGESATIYANGEKMYGDAEEGSTIPYPPTVSLETNNWNLIGVYGTNDPSIDWALETLTDQSGHEYYDVIYDQYANSYSETQLLESTKGYWLSVKLIPGAESIQYKASYNMQEPLA